MIFLDANFVLELLLPGRARTEEAIELLRKTNGETAISLLSAHLIFHFGRKYRISDATLQAAVASHQLLTVERADYDWALQYEVGKDFEDALQVGVAVRYGCERFVSLDTKLTRRYGEYIEFTTP